MRGETLAERAWRTLGEACDERIAVGKGELALPFEVLVEPAEPQAPIAGVVAGLRAAAHETSVFLPVDCPLVTPQLLRELGEHAAVPQTGPLPGAYTKDDLPELERRLASQDYTLRGVNLRVRQVDVRLLADVDSPDALSALEEHLAALDDHRDLTPSRPTSRPSRAIICAVPATPSTVTRRPRRKSRAPRSS